MSIADWVCDMACRPLEQQLANLECNAVCGVAITHHFLALMVRRLQSCTCIHPASCAAHDCADMPRSVYTGGEAAARVHRVHIKRGDRNRVAVCGAVRGNKGVHVLGPLRRKPCTRR